MALHTDINVLCESCFRSTWLTFVYIKYAWRELSCRNLNISVQSKNPLNPCVNIKEMSAYNFYIRCINAFVVFAH